MTSGQNDINYLIHGPDGRLYFINEEQIAEFEIPEESSIYQKFKQDAVAQAIQTAAIVADEEGNWQPFGASCICVFIVDATEDDETLNLVEGKTAPVKLAYVNLDFGMAESFDMTINQLENGDGGE